MSSEQRKDQTSTEAVDVESAKRNLQALVAAGIQAQDLLDGSDDMDSSDGSSDDSEVDDNDQNQDFSFEKAVLENSNDNGSAHTDSVISSYMFKGGEPANGDNADPEKDTADSRQELLSRVASNFQTLIGHGLATAAGGAAHAEADDGDDDEAYQLACKTLENNLRYQRLLRAQLAAIDAAQSRNAELQENIGMLLSLQGRATTRRGGRRGRDERSAIDPVTGEPKIGASTFFVDADGERPPRNRDTIRKEKHPPIVYRARRWTEAEREALARGVRQNNRKILSQRLFQQTKDPRSIWEVEKMADSELEMNLAGLDWKYISKNFVPQHKSVECAIQWATQDHPIINRAPWTRREEKALSDVVEQHDGRDWVAIAKELGTQRTAAQCFQVYQRKLNPDMSRSKWTPEEDRVLTEAVMTYGEGDWQAVAACLDNRTGQQVLHRWCKSINPAIRSGRWDRDEDIALLAAVRLYGVGQWTKIAKHVPGRTDVKCRERYMNVLTPDVNNSQWTHDEDERLIAIVSRVGIGKWSYVADLLGGRTDNQCWRHWRSLHKRGRAPDPPEDPEDECDEGTVPTFPEWDAHSPTPDSVPSSARKRKSLSGIDSARKRQWKRATSTNFVPLLAAPPDGMLDTPARLPRSSRTRSAGNMRSADMGHFAETPTRRGRPVRASAAIGDASPSPLAGSSRRASSHRRGRALNWSNVLHVGAEGKAAPDQAHIRPVLPCLGTAQSLLRLVHAVPEVATAFNAELVGIDSDGSAPPLDSLPMNWLRQRIEMLFIWPLMLGTLDTQQQQQQQHR